MYARPVINAIIRLLFADKLNAVLMVPEWCDGSSRCSHPHTLAKGRSKGPISCHTLQTIFMLCDIHFHTYLTHKEGVCVCVCVCVCVLMMPTKFDGKTCSPTCTYTYAHSRGHAHKVVNAWENQGSLRLVIRAMI